MKGNIKKLVILVIITVIAPFIIAVMASAEPPTTHNIRGQYYATGGGTCLLALSAITTLKSEPVVAWLVDSYSWEGVYTFEPNGAGTTTALQFHVQRPGPQLTTPPKSFTSKLTWKFTYTVMDAGRISFTLVPGTYKLEFVSGSQLSGQAFSADAIPTEGVISPGDEIMTSSSVSQQLINFNALQNIPPGGLFSCNASIVLVKQHDTNP